MTILHTTTTAPIPGMEEDPARHYHEVEDTGAEKEYRFWVNEIIVDPAMPKKCWTPVQGFRTKSEAIEFAKANQ